MEEANTNLTDGSLRGAASVLRTLSEECRLPSRHHGRYLATAERLDRIVDYREEERSDSEERRIPIPQEALDADSFEDIVAHVHGGDE